MIKRVMLLIAIFWLTFSSPAVCQDIFRSFYFHFSYGQSFFSSNSSPSYSFICPEAKMGLGLTKEWNRLGMRTSILAGIRFSTSKDFPYQMYIDEAKLYMLLQERSYSSDSEFLEIPFTIHYYLVEDRLSIHAGLSARWYLNVVPPLEYQGLEGIQIDRYNLGILSMLSFKVSKRIAISLDYFRGLKKLNEASSSSSNKEYYLRGDFAQFSLLIMPFNLRDSK